MYNGFFYKFINYVVKKYQWLSVANAQRSFKQLGPNCYLEYPVHLINSKYVSIGSNFSAKYNLRIETFDQFEGDSYTPEICIGDNVIMNTDVHIGCIQKVHIGNNVLMASRIYISDHSHGDVDRHTLEIIPAKRPLTIKGDVVIEDNVWIGEGVAILPGVRVGRNAVIGANAVVTKDVPAFSVVAGVPAKVIRQF